MALTNVWHLLNSAFAKWGESYRGKHGQVDFSKINIREVKQSPLDDDTERKLLLWPRDQEKDLKHYNMSMIESIQCAYLQSHQWIGIWIQRVARERASLLWVPYLTFGNLILSECYVEMSASYRQLQNRHNSLLKKNTKTNHSFWK